MEDEDKKRDNNLLIKVGASVASVLGISLLGYLFYGYFKKKNSINEEGEKLKGDIKKSHNKNNLDNQPGEEVTEMTFMDARIDTLVQGDIEFPTSYWKEENVVPWIESRNKLFKRCFCGKNAENEKVLQCGKCKGIFYCCRDHQSESWTVRNHKSFCSKLQTANNLTFTAFKRLLIENSPPVNRSEFATEDTLNLVLKRLFDNKFEDEAEEACLLKEVGRLCWMLAQIKYNNKPGSNEFQNMMDLSFQYLQNAWSKEGSMEHDLELRSQTQWLMGEHYMVKNLGRGCFFLYNSVLDMLKFHARLVDRMKIEETKKLIQIWVAAMIERLMSGDYIEQATNVLEKVLVQAENREDVEWQLQTIDLQCLIQAYIKSKEKNILVELSPTSSFTKDMHRFYEDTKKENTKYQNLNKQLQQMQQNNPYGGNGGNQQYSPEEFERMMKTMMNQNN